MNNVLRQPRPSGIEETPLESRRRISLRHRSTQWQKEKSPCRSLTCKGFDLAERTGLEPATPGVTGRYSNQLNYHSW